MKAERIIIPREQVIYTYPNHEDIPVEEMMLAQLLMDRVMHTNNGTLRHGTWKSDPSVICFVNCSDIFAWGCADSESVEGTDSAQSPLRDLYEMHMADPKWGSAKWCILKRKERPQRPVLRDMKADGAWFTDELVLATLKPNEYDRISAEQAAQRKAAEVPDGG